MEENINKYKNTNNKIPVWLCEKCQNVNLVKDVRCLKCNYFNYDAYAGNYENLNDSDERINFKNKQNIDEKPIKLKGDFIDYNFKENYEFKRQEKHKFIKCWHCGRENIYYKLKCNYCRFTINDSEEPKIEKTKLTQYDIMHGITFDKLKIKNAETKYNDIKIKSNVIKEEKKYKNLGVNWTCKFCKKINKESIKYCNFCFKDRL
jgi:hypothetical protein